MNKSAIKNFAIEARKILIKSAVTEAGMYGISIDSIAKPIQSTSEMEIYENLAGTETRIYGDSIKQRKSLVNAIEEKGFENVMEEVAYTWFNRLIAIRFMEVNDYLPSRVRVLSSETPGKKEPDLVTNFVDAAMDLNITQEELETIQTAKDNNKYDDAFRILFMKQCNALNEILPALFEKTSDYTELLLRLSFTNEEGVVRMLVDSVPEEDFNVSETDENGNATGQVEIVGWLYQYYNTELKDDTFAKLKKNVKITKERIPAATQLFTPDWIVRYMVENSVGRIWIEHLRANNPELDEKTTAEKYGWKYYLPEAEQDENVAVQLVEIRKDYKNLEPQDITCIDPCMGSGHILVYMFDVLMDIYKSAGFTERESAFSILEHNIRGLDIDQRAYQLSYFALMMKARGYNRRFFAGKEKLDGERKVIEPKVYALLDSNELESINLDLFGYGFEESIKKSAILQIKELINTFIDVKEYGSLITVKEFEWDILKKFANKTEEIGQMSFDMLSTFNYKDKLLTMIKVGEILSKKYNAVVTNPPYMGLSNGGTKLNTFCKKAYPHGKADLCTCFMEKTIDMCKKNGYMSMINIPAWMSLVSFNDLRKDIITQNRIDSLIQFGRGVFGSDFGSVAFVIAKRFISGNAGTYLKLYKKQGSVDSVDDKEQMFFSMPRYLCKQDNFSVIPGFPIAYWLTNQFFETFNNPTVGSYLITREGMATADNERFLRLWYEVSGDKFAFDYTDTNFKMKKWYPYNKGGDYRKWYGNANYIVNWENDGYDIRNNIDKKTGRIRSHNYNGEYAFREGLTWTSLSISSISVRYSPEGFLFDSKGAMGFCNDRSKMIYTIALLNSCVGSEYLKIFSPTVDFKVGDVIQLPYIGNNLNSVVKLTEELIALAKEDWDSKETSWNFIRNPLIPELIGKDNDLEDLYKQYAESIEKRFDKVKENEEKINILLMEDYGLQNELDYKVDSKSIVMRKANKKNDIIELISYAVGCILGRYSIHSNGVAYAGGEWNVDKYKELLPDIDNIVPITDENYFNDDLTALFFKWTKYVYGENFFEKNIMFIADALDTKGETYNEKIRNYFLNNFYSNHCIEYSITGSGKRPIYWLFDSGKENGFKALIYMHRYDKDTVARIRTDYLHNTQGALENALKNAEYIINTTTSATDRTKAKKAQDKYMKQLAETRIYDQALAYVANQRIEIDLDDGVKHNYELFQNIEISNEGSKKQIINLLAKI